MIQAVLFSKNYYTTSQARKWLKKENLKPIKRVHKTNKYLRYRIKNPSEFNYLRTFSIGNKIKYIYGYGSFKKSK